MAQNEEVVAEENEGVAHDARRFKRSPLSDVRRAVREDAAQRYDLGRGKGVAASVRRDRETAERKWREAPTSQLLVIKQSDERGQFAALTCNA
jgi:hypothetical protein